MCNSTSDPYNIYVCDDWDGSDEVCIKCGGLFAGCGGPGYTGKAPNNRQSLSCPAIQTNASEINETNNNYSETVPVTGADFSLVYTSNRDLGRVDDYKLVIPLFNLAPMTTVDTIDVSINVAGQVAGATYPIATAPQFHEWTWDGKDNLGQLLGSGAEAQVSVGYVATNPSDPSFSIGFNLPMGNPKFIVLGIGGWSLSNNHYYEIDTGRLYLGNGQTVQAKYVPVSAGVVGVTLESESEIYLFNTDGLHLETLAGLTGATLATFSYNSNFQLTSYTDAYSRSTTFNRDTSGNLTSITTPDGVVTNIVLNANGYLEEVVNPDSETFEMTYTTSNLLKTFTKPTGEVTTFHHDSLGNLTKDSHSGGSFFDYAVIPNLATKEFLRTTAEGREKTIKVYNTTSAPGTVVTDPMGVVTTQRESDLTQYFERGDFSNLFTQTTDPRFGANAKVPSSNVEVQGTLTKNTAYSSVVNLSNPSDFFSIVTLTNEETINSRVYESVYTGSTKTWVHSTPEGRTQQIILNNYQQPTSIQNGPLEPVAITYNTQGKTWKITQDTRETILAYNTSGYLSSITNDLGQTTSFGYDLAGRVTSQTLPDTRVIGFSYDNSGRLTGVTPPGKPAHGFFYNAMEVLQQYLPPILGGTAKPINYVYNLDKQLTEVERSDGTSVFFNRNATTGALDSISTTSSLYSYTYETTKGLLESATSYDSLKNTFVYNGELLVEDKTEDSSTSTQLARVNTTFDNNFWKTSFAVKGNSSSTAVTQTFTRDDDGLVTGVAGATYTYHATAPILTAITQGLSSETFDYNIFGELTERYVEYNSIPVYLLEYTRDDLGRVATKTESYGSSSDVFAYSYDVSGRLATVTKNSSPYSSYTYDDNNNLLSGSAGGVSILATYDNQDRILTFNDYEFIHNDNGEMTEKEDTSTSAVTTFTYNAMGALTQVNLPGSNVVSYKLDGLGRRVSRSYNSTVTNRYVYLGDSLVGEVDGSGNVSSSYVYVSQAHSPDFMIRSGTTFKFIKDHLGSIRTVIRLSDGVVMQEIEYSEFGFVLSDSNPGYQPFGFAGGLYDHQTGLVKFGAREYDASIVRWLSKDPIGFDGLDTNLYGYVFQDPINYIDTDGHFAFPLIVPLIPVLTNTALWGGVIVSGGLLLDQLIDAYSKGGKQNVGDTGLQGLTPEQVKDLYDKAKGKDRKRYEKQLKWLKEKNKKKRGNC